MGTETRLKKIEPFAYKIIFAHPLYVIFLYLFDGIIFTFLTALGFVFFQSTSCTEGLATGTYLGNSYDVVAFYVTYDM